MNAYRGKQRSGIPALLRIGDTLDVPLYGMLPGTKSPVLLLAAGERIESDLQLRRLRDGGYPVDLPAEEETPAPSAASPPPSEAQATFGERVRQATSVQQRVIDGVKVFMDRVREGLVPDYGALEAVSRELADEVARDACAFTAVTYLRDCGDPTHGHGANVALLMAAVAHMLGLSTQERRTLTLAGLLHDIGKQRVPLGTLRKPGPLSSEEMQQLRRHPLDGRDLLSEWPECPSVVRSVVIQHHERLDGSGYPLGLLGDDIPLCSRIAAVADAFEAMSADRAFRRAVSAREAVLDLFGNQDRLYDSRVVMALIRLVGLYPVGTRVALNTGETGVVVVPNPTNLTRPMVVVDRDPAGRPLAKPFPLSFRSDARYILDTAS